MTELIRIVSGKNRSALRFAERAHRGVNRKGADVPYILHPIAVAEILAGAGGDRNLVCAGCLHDVVEDCGVTLEEIRDEFGSEVAILVAAVTKSDTTVRAPNVVKAEMVMGELTEVGMEAFALKGADVLANMTDLVLDAEEEGVQHFRDLFGDRAGRKIDYYLELANLLAAELAHDRGYASLAAALVARAAELRSLRCEL